MLSSVLNSEIAVEINIRIIRIFVEIRQAVAIQPEYEILREKVKRIEAEIKEIKLGQVAETHLSNKKVIHLSNEVRELNQNVEYFSEVLDRFQDGHLIIKRPNEWIVP